MVLLESKLVVQCSKVISKSNKNSIIEYFRYHRADQNPPEVIYRKSIQSSILFRYQNCITSSKITWQVASVDKQVK